MNSLIEHTDAVIAGAEKTSNAYFYYNSFLKVYALLLKESSISNALRVKCCN